MAVGVVLASLFPTPGAAQVRPDSAARDTTRKPVVHATDSAAVEPDSVMRARILARSDSARRAFLADTIKAPVARFDMPDARLELTERLRFSREQIMTASAVDIADLLDRVPGIATFRSSWLAGIHAAAYNGDARRIRFFLDGVELDGIDPRGGGAVDLTEIPLWTLDELVVEKTPGEVRVWMRTLSATNITPFSRVDIFTGDLNTNAFRGFIARRWRNGMMFQAGGQQVATQSGRVSAFSTGSTQGERSAGSVQLFMTRIGWARGKWSADIYGQGGARDRDPHMARDSVGYTNLPSYKGSRREGYLRLGYGDTSSGLWSQALVHTAHVKIEPDSASSRDTVFGAAAGPSSGQSVVRPDTIVGRNQQVLAVGYRAANWAVSLTDRVRPLNGSVNHSPVLRASYHWRGVTLGTWLERNGPDSISRTEITAQYRPTSWLAFNAAHSSRTPTDSLGEIATSAVRIEGAVRYRDIWLRGGILRDNPVEYSNMALLSLPGIRLFAPAAQGVLFAASGKIYKDLGFDLHALRWNTSQFSRPPLQLRAEVNLITEWLSRFPSGEFGINARLSYELRDATPFFYGVKNGDQLDIRTTEKAQVATAHLEIRIQRGTLFYQFRNLTGGQYEQIRGITMPPAIQMYGMRWEFWN